MNLDQLRTVQSTERQKDSLQELRPSFYEEVGEYVAELEAERDRIAGQSDDPFASPEVSRLTDEIETVKDVVQAIYERRMGKLVKQASLSAAGMSADESGLTIEEAKLFDDLVERIETNQQTVMAVLDGRQSSHTLSETDVENDSQWADDDRDRSKRGIDTDDEPDRASPPEDTPNDGLIDDTPPEPSQSVDDQLSSESTPTDEEQSPADTAAQSGATEQTQSSNETGESTTTDEPSDEHATDGAGSQVRQTGSNVDRITVRITRDIGSIFGVDEREYTLSSDDVVRLPTQNATPLVEQDAAEPLE